eukprot:g3143.t1
MRITSNIFLGKVEMSDARGGGTRYVVEIKVEGDKTPSSPSSPSPHRGHSHHHLLHKRSSDDIEYDVVMTISSEDKGALDEFRKHALLHKDALNVPHNTPTVDMRFVEKKAKIASGAFGSVFVGMRGGEEVAVKMIPFENIPEHSSGNLHFKTVQEIALSNCLRHENVILTHGHSFFCEGPIQHLVIISELCSADLYDVLHASKGFAEEEKYLCDWCPELFPRTHVLAKDPSVIDLFYRIVSGVVRGLRYIHERHIIHRDLKPQNVLLRRSAGKSKSRNNFVVKICDFGLSRSADEDELDVDSRGAPKTEGCGTLPYMAPELFGYGEKEVPYDNKVDVYAFGIMLWEMWFKLRPFWEINKAMTLRRSIMQGKRPILPKDTQLSMGSEIRRIVQMCWDEDPKKRPSFDDIGHMLDVFKPQHLARFNRDGASWFQQKSRRIRGDAPKVVGFVRDWCDKRFQRKIKGEQCRFNYRSLSMDFKAKFGKQPGILQVYKHRVFRSMLKVYNSEASKYDEKEANAKECLNSIDEQVRHFEESMVQYINGPQRRIQELGDALPSASTSSGTVSPAPMMMLRPAHSIHPPSTKPPVLRSPKSLDSPATKHSDGVEALSEKLSGLSRADMQRLLTTLDASVLEALRAACE